MSGTFLSWFSEPLEKWIVQRPVLDEPDYEYKEMDFDMHGSEVNMPPEAEDAPGKSGSLKRVDAGLYTFSCADDIFFHISCQEDKIHIFEIWDDEIATISFFQGNPHRKKSSASFQSHDAATFHLKIRSDFIQYMDYFRVLATDCCETVDSILC